MRICDGVSVLELHLQGTFGIGQWYRTAELQLSEK